MEATLKREDLVRGLHLVQGVVERRSTLPILLNVHIEPCEEGVALTATDTEVGLRVRVRAQTTRKAAITLSARKLYEITRELTTPEVTIRAATAGWVEVHAGRSKFKVVSMDAKDFPVVPLATAEGTGASFTVGAGILREMIDKTIFAVSMDETRFNLSGVFAESTDKGALRMVATDGHRLAVIERELPGAKLPRGSILPRKGVAEVRKLLDEIGDGEVTIAVGDKDFRLHGNAVSFFMRL